MIKYKTKKIREATNIFLDNKLKEPVRLLKPKDLKKSMLIAWCPEDWYDEEHFLNSCRWIIHTIMEKSLDDYGRKGNGFFKLSSTVIKSIIGSEYNKVIEALVKGGIIECDGLYSAKRHVSFGYKLTEEYESRSYQYITLSESRLTKNIKIFRKKKIEELKGKAYHLPQLTQWLIQPGLELDKPAALDFLAELEVTMWSVASRLPLKEKAKEKVDHVVKVKINKYRHLIETFSIDAGFTIDNSGGRLYSPLTHLPSIFRNFLHYKGQPLTYLDIHNSQPYHFQALLRKAFWLPKRPQQKGEGTLQLKDLEEDLYRHIETEEETLLSSTMFPEDRQTLAGQGLFSFLSLASNGKLYEFLCNRLSGKLLTPGNRDRFSTRTDTKAEMMHMLFYNPREQFSSAGPVFEEFKKLFPQEAVIIEVLKSRSHTDFPVLLQKVEADMLLNRTCKAVFKESPDLPLFSIHDGIITLETEKERVKELLEQTYQAEFGNIPQMSIHPLDPVQAVVEKRKYAKEKMQHSFSPGSFIKTSEPPTGEKPYLGIDAELYDQLTPVFARYTTYPGPYSG
jgi:hypothetical protein